jgi:hypothetical protein
MSISLAVEELQGSNQARQSTLGQPVQRPGLRLKQPGNPMQAAQQVQTSAQALGQSVQNAVAANADDQGKRLGNPPQQLNNQQPQAARQTPQNRLGQQQNLKQLKTGQLPPNLADDVGQIDQQLQQQGQPRRSMVRLKGQDGQPQAAVPQPGVPAMESAGDKRDAFRTDGSMGDPEDDESMNDLTKGTVKAMDKRIAAIKGDAGKGISYLGKPGVHGSKYKQLSSEKQIATEQAAVLDDATRSAILDGIFGA